MNLGSYEFNIENLLAYFRMPKSSLKVKIFGIPKIEGSNLKEIAENILKKNAKEVLIAGAGHFKYMWAVDFGKALVGASKVLPGDYLKKQIQLIIDESCRKGYVPTCFSKTRSFNSPFKRQDNFPWLVNATYNYSKIFSDNSLLEENKSKIEDLYNKYLNDYFDFEKFLLKIKARFDWMDTILRPSSTYSNLCLLNMFKLSREMKLKIKTFEKELEKAIMARWNGRCFIDYENSGEYLSADANVPVLYFNLFSKELRKRIYETIEESDLVRPFPIKSREGEYKKHKTFLAHFLSSYHSVIWPHLGFMYLNGLKKNGFPYRHHFEKIEKAIWEKKNFLEVLNENRGQFSSVFISTEYNFTMAAGQYLELIN